MVLKSLLVRRAPAHGEIAYSVPSGTVIPIHDSDPDVFGGLLHFIYSDEPPENMDNRAVLEIADRFGSSRLKLIAETEIVKAGITAEKLAELLLFAGAHSCALLREAALDFCVTHPSAIKDSEGWGQLKESADLLAELLELLGPPPQFSDSDYDAMRVATLRQTLDDKGLDVDGARQAFIHRLKDADAAET